MAFVRGEHLDAFRAHMAMPDGDRWQSYLEPRTGEAYPVGITLVPVTDPEGSVQLRWTIRDITEQARVESEILALNLELEGRIAARTEELLDAVRLRDQALEAERVARTDADASDARSEFLEHLGALLLEPGDLDATLVQAALRAVPGLADVCLIDRIGHDGALEPVATATVPSLSAERAGRLRNFGLIRALQSRVLRSGDAEVDCERISRVPETAFLGCLLAAPIRADNRSWGTFLLLITDSGRTLGERDARLAMTVARRLTQRIEAGASPRRDPESPAGDEFLAMLGHELRNPASAIRHSVAVLENQLPEGHRSAVQILLRQSRHLARLVDDLSDLTRLGHGKLVLQTRSIDLGELARRCVQNLVDSGRSDSWRVRIETQPVCVQGDATRLQQVIENLLDNALKYSPAGSVVEVLVRAEETAAVLVVRDHGKGVPAGMSERIFDPYVQVRGAEDAITGGLGLGLGLVKRLVELHGGTVQVRSMNASEGSEFVVRLPSVVSEDPPELEGWQRRATPPLRILVVEDRPDSREALRLLLQMWGHEVAEAYDGPTAIAQVRSFRPSLAIVDIGLPGMDGLELARALREITGGPRWLVALTGYGRPGDRQEALDAGFDEHILKPPGPDELEDLLSRLASASAGL